MIHTIEDTNYPSPNGPAGKAFNNTANTQSRLQRRINDTSRLQREAIMDLQRLQAERRQLQPQPPAPLPAPQPVETESPASQIGFVPQTLLLPPTPEAQPESLTPENRVSGIDASTPLPPAPGIRPPAPSPQPPPPGPRPPAPGPRPPNGPP